MKKIIIASVLALSLAAGLAYAHNSGSGMIGYSGHMMNGGHGMMGGGYGMMGSGMRGGYGGYGECPGAATSGGGGWNSEDHQKFLKDTVELRREVNDKNFEYFEAQRDPEVSREKLVELEKELIEIRSKIQEKAKQYR